MRDNRGEDAIIASMWLLGAIFYAKFGGDVVVTILMLIAALAWLISSNV